VEEGGDTLRNKLDDERAQQGKTRKNGEMTALQQGEKTTSRRLNYLYNPHTGAVTKRK